MSFVAFLYGFATAIIGVMVAIVVGFSKVRLVTAEKLQRIESTFETTQRSDADAAAKLDPIKVTSKVKIVRFDHSFMAGVPKNCRIVMLASTITVYELPADGNGGSSVSSTMTSADMPNGGQADASAVAPKKNASHQTQPGERLLGKIHVGSVVPIIHQNTPPAGVKVVPGDLSTMFGAVLVLKCRPDSATQLLFLPQSVGSDQPSSSNPTPQATPNTAMSCTDDMPHLWTSIAIKFLTKRDLERWTNALSASSETDSWRAFVKSLPSLDVLNIFIARLVFENNKKVGAGGGALNRLIRTKIDRKLRVLSKNLPRPLSGFITAQSVKLGDNIPLVNDVSFLSYSTNGELGFDFNLDYRGGFTVTLVATLSVRSVQIPQLIFIVRLVELKGKVHVSIGAPPSSRMWIGFHSPPVVNIDFKQEVASHDGVLSAVVGLIPDLSDFISNLVKISLFEDMVLPKMEDLPLPNVESDKDDDDDDIHDDLDVKDIVVDISGSSSRQPLRGTPQKDTNNRGPATTTPLQSQDLDSFVMVEHAATRGGLPSPANSTSAGGSGGAAPTDLVGETLRRRLLARPSSHGRTSSGSGGGDFLNSSGVGMNTTSKSPVRQRGFSPTPAPKDSKLQNPTPPPSTPPLYSADAQLPGQPTGVTHQASLLPDAVRQKSDNVKAVLAQKAAELRRAAATAGSVNAARSPAPLEGEASPITPAGGAGHQAGRNFVQPQWSNSKW